MRQRRGRTATRRIIAAGRAERALIAAMTAPPDLDPPEAECRACRQRIQLLGGAWTDPDGVTCCYQYPTSAIWAPHRPED